MRLAALTLVLACAAAAQSPLQAPLAEFDKLAAQFKSSVLVGEPVPAGAATLVPFAKLHFMLGSATLPIAIGGMGGKTTPLGILVVEGDDVRVEAFPVEAEKPGLVEQLITAILDHKVSIIGNAVNLGNAPGSLQELTPMITGLAGGITTVGNGLNLGSIAAPKPPAAPPKTAAPTKP